jgi:hypothetical protein
MTWYAKIAADINNLPGFIQYCEDEIALAKKEIAIYGNVEKNISALPGLTEQRFNQLQEVEAVLRLLEIRLKKIRRKYFQKYLESYNRALTSRDAEKYVEGEDEVVDFESLINEIALIRNKFLGIIKGLESKNFMLGHVVRLRVAGMEDIAL